MTPGNYGPIVVPPDISFLFRSGVTGQAAIMDKVTLTTGLTGRINIFEGCSFIGSPISMDFAEGPGVGDKFSIVVFKDSAVLQGKIQNDTTTGVGLIAAGVAEPTAIQSINFLQTVDLGAAGFLVATYVKFYDAISAPAIQLVECIASSSITCTGTQAEFYETTFPEQTTVTFSGSPGVAKFDSESALEFGTTGGIIENGEPACGPDGPLLLRTTTSFPDPVSAAISTGAASVGLGTGHTLADCKMLGVVSPAQPTVGGVALVLPVGSRFSVSGLTAGVLYRADDGTPVLKSSLSSGDYTERMGIYTGADGTMFVQGSEPILLP